MSSIACVLLKYLYLKRLPLKKRLLLDTVRTWLDFSSLRGEKHAEKPCEQAWKGLFSTQFCTLTLDSLVEGLVLDSTLPQMFTGLGCRCKVCQYNLSFLGSKKKKKTFIILNNFNKNKAPTWLMMSQGYHQSKSPWIADTDLTYLRLICINVERLCFKLQLCHLLPVWENHERKEKAQDK